MTSSANLVALLKEHEGLRLKPYLCPAGVPTIGFGTTAYPDGKRVTLADSAITEGQAEEFLCHDLKRFEAAVNSIKVVLTQNQYDALVSFTYNVGATAFKNSTLAKKVRVNPGDESIRNEFNKWVNGGGKKLPGLVRRRADEANLFFT